LIELQAQSQILKIRENSFREICDFIVQNGSVPDVSLIILCGDFNIHRDPLNKYTFTYLMEKDPNWKDLIPRIDREYDETFQIFRDQFPTCFNVWDTQNPTERCITYGKCKISDDGKLTPLETLLTLPHELCAELCLDYILCIRKSPSINFENTQVEPMFTDQFEFPCDYNGTA
jgi:hypothetical protein